MTARSSRQPVCVGIDVGGARKGFHAVALRGTTLLDRFRSPDPAALVAWCRAAVAEVVAVDAPCRWRREGGPPRSAERALAAARIGCFPTPTEARARGHPFFAWMQCGAALYAVLERSHPLYAGDAARRPVCFETFPQAVACALAGERVSAKEKRPVRTALLRRAGIDVSRLASIDDLDAALCALTAARFAAGDFLAYGEPADGCLIVPRTALPGPTP